MIISLIVINVIGLLFSLAYILVYLSNESDSDKSMRRECTIIFKHGICYPVDVFKWANATYNMIGSTILATLSIIIYPAFAVISIIFFLILSIHNGFYLIFKKKDKEN
jgi:hypothetical protein